VTIVSAAGDGDNPIQLNRLTALTPFDFNTPNPGDRITIASLWIGRADTAHVKPNLLVPNALALETTTCFIGDDDILRGYFAFAAHFRVKVVEDGANLFFNGARAREYQGRSDMADWAVLGQSQSLQALKTLGARPLQIGEVVLGTLARDGDFRFARFPRP